METRKTQIVAKPTNLAASANFESDNEFTQKRLDALLKTNAETAREKSLFRSEQEKNNRALMKNPLSAKQTFQYFGLLLGTFTPLAIFVRLFSDKEIFRGEDFWFVGVVAVVNLISAIVGYFSGGMIAGIVADLERQSWQRMILTLPFVGMLWGIMAGGAGGAVIFLFGAFFGAALGAAVGSVALPAFVVIYRALKNGDQIDRRHFLPIASGITFVISAFILGL